MKSNFQCKKFQIFFILYAQDMVSLVKTALEVQVCHVRKLVQIFVQNRTYPQRSMLHGIYGWKDHQVNFPTHPTMHHLDF